MFEPEWYELLDFGSGRKLERFGLHILDRPCPAADRATPSEPEIWAKASARYDQRRGEKGCWSQSEELAPDKVSEGDPWQVHHGEMRLLMQLAA